MDLQKAYEIKDARIQFVSLVDKAANKRTFLLKKAADGKAAFTTCGRIVKADAENHYVTGIVYEPLEEDSQGNFMTEAEITKAAYWYAKNSSQVDLQHSFEPMEGAAVVETWIAKADFDMDGIPVRRGTWLMTMEVSDADIWDKIEKGEISGFSMGGIGEYSEEDVQLEQVKKAGKKMSGRNRETLTGIYESLGVFLKEFDPESEEGGEAREKTAPEDGNKQQEPKDGADKSEREDKEVTKQEVEQIVESEIAKALGAAQVQQTPETAPADTGAVEKTAGDSTTPATAITPEAIEKMVASAIEKAMKPKQEPVTVEQVAGMIDAAVAKAVEPVLKSRGLPSNLNGDGVEKSAGSEQHYLHGIL